MEFTPGWCIGWFFIPLAHLVKPFQAVRETWRASISSRRNWQENSSSPLVWLWWTLWIVSIVLEQAVFRMSFGAESLQQLRVASNMTLLAEALNIPLAIIALVMIHRLYSLQNEKFARGEQTTNLASNRHSCRFCGESVHTTFGDCPMCGEPLAASIRDHQSDESRMLQLS